MHISSALLLAEEINQKHSDILKAQAFQYRIPHGYVRLSPVNSDEFKDVFSRESWYAYAERIGIQDARPAPIINNDIPESF